MEGLPMKKARRCAIPRRRPHPPETVYEIDTTTVRLVVAEPAPARIRAGYEAVKLVRAILADLDADQEHFVLIALDAAMHVRSFKVLFSGAQCSSLVDPKIVFRTALLMGASRIILAHNHPSGDPEPSQEDLSMARRLRQAGALLDVRVDDQLTVAAKAFRSCGY